mmetsp:Transcript_18672/g.61077  ORF Transcript_18672/g.61077 Transcript_18672/m.61077 type:complete len:633 (+) Transcript_18672:79-1977(+)
MANMDVKIEALEREIASLHKSLEARGVNSTGVTDIYGRRFPVPVDSEHKATQLFSTLFKGVMPNAPQPHMYAFWVSAFGFFCTFFSVFAPAALMPYIRRSPEDGGIGLTGVNIADSGSAAVGGTIVMRVLAGPLCDMIGARRTFFLLLWLGVPGIIILAFAQNAGGMIAARLLIGLSLATFVTCQVWCSQMFSRAVVGTANATAGGWGNLGGGVTQLVMPYVMLGFMQATGSDGPGVDRAWRMCMIVPAALHVIASVLVILGRDLPDGNFKELETSGAKQKSQGGKAVLIGFSNINAWILTITYGFCFGVELTMNNTVVLYFYRYYGVTPQIAGVLGSCFGLMNLFARSWGGMLSDILNAKYGMRGRLWSMWIIQTLEGLMCLIMGLVTINMPSPDRKVCPDGSLCRTTAEDRMWGKWQTENPPVGSTFTYGVTYTYRINSTNAAFIRPCGSESIARPKFGWLVGADGSEEYMPIPSTEDFIVIGDVDNLECVRNAGTLGVTMTVMILFSVFVQMAEGLHFGVVPYVSRPALGVVSGMVGAGGNAGAVVGSKLIISGTKATDQGLVELGITIMVVSLIMHFIYFPEHGAMLVKPGGLGKYDPQLYKPAADARGADQMDYTKVNTLKTEKADA